MQTHVHIVHGQVVRSKNRNLLLAVALILIAECLSARHIIGILFSLSVYYIYASRLGMRPQKPLTIQVIDC